MTQITHDIRPAFWSDDFDMDLFKVIPAAEAILAGARAIRMVTFGGLTNGRLNHPACWNGMDGFCAFFGMPGIPQLAWLPPGYVTSNETLVECNGEEALRDWWPHSYIMYLNGFAVTPKLNDYYDVFSKLMWHIRRVEVLPEAEYQDAIFDVQNILVEAVDRMQKIVRVG